MSTPQDSESDDIAAENQAAEARRRAIEAAKARPPLASMDTAYRMVGPVLLGMAIGYFIDQQFQTRPWWMLGMTFFGLLTGFWSMLRPLYFSSKSDPNSPD